MRSLSTAGGMPDRSRIEMGVGGHAKWQGCGRRKWQVFRRPQRAEFEVRRDRGIVIVEARGARLAAPTGNLEGPCTRETSGCCCGGIWRRV